MQTNKCHFCNAPIYPGEKRCGITIRIFPDQEEDFLWEEPCPEDGVCHGGVPFRDVWMGRRGYRGFGGRGRVFSGGPHGSLQGMSGSVPVEPFYQGEPVFLAKRAQPQDRPLNPALYGTAPVRKRPPEGGHPLKGPRSPSAHPDRYRSVPCIALPPRAR